MDSGCGKVPYPSGNIRTFEATSVGITYRKMWPRNMVSLQSTAMICIIFLNLM